MTTRDQEPLTEAQRGALLVHLDAVLFAWAGAAEGAIEDALSDYIDRITDRLEIHGRAKDALIDAACHRANALCSPMTITDILAQIEDAS